MCKWLNEAMSKVRNYQKKCFLHFSDKIKEGLEFLLNNTNLTFVAFCTNWHQGLSKSTKYKVESTGNQTHNTNHIWIRRQMPIPLCHSDLCWIEDPYVELCFIHHFHSKIGLGSFLDSIEHDFIRVWKSETDKEWQIGWVGKAMEF